MAFMEQHTSSLKLRRSQNACLGGVCAGIAEHYELDPIVVRILALLVAIATVGFGALVYIAAWALLPQGPPPQALYEVSPEQAESSAYGCVDCSAYANTAQDSESLSIAVWLIVAICLTVLFLLVVLNISPLVSGSHWWQFWPIALVIGGICLVVIPNGGMHEMAWHALGAIVVALAISFLPMSLGIASWDTFGFALEHLWLLVVASVILFAIGAYRSIGALTVLSALLAVLFCLITITSFMIPGEVAHLLINMPDGRSLRIAIASTLLLW